MTDTTFPTIVTEDEELVFVTRADVQLWDAHSALLDIADQLDVSLTPAGDIVRFRTGLHYLAGAARAAEVGRDWDGGLDTAIGIIAELRNKSYTPDGRYNVFFELAVARLTDASLYLRGE